MPEQTNKTTSLCILMNAVIKEGKAVTSCLLCRHRKLKCDRIVPECSRCANGGHSCVYTAATKRPPVKAEAISHANLSASGAVGLTGADNCYLQAFVACFGPSVLSTSPSAVPSLFLSSVGSFRDGPALLARCATQAAAQEMLLLEGQACAAVALGAVLSGECQDPQRHVQAMLLANLNLQTALKLSSSGGSSSGGRALNLGARSPSPPWDDATTTASSTAESSSTNGSEAGDYAGNGSGNGTPSPPDSAAGSSSSSPRSRVVRLHHQLCVLLFLESVYYLLTGQRALWHECSHHAQEALKVARQEEAAAVGVGVKALGRGVASNGIESAQLEDVRFAAAGEFTGLTAMLSYLQAADDLRVFSAWDDSEDQQLPPPDLPPPALADIKAEVALNGFHGSWSPPLSERGATQSPATVSAAAAAGFAGNGALAAPLDMAGTFWGALRFSLLRYAPILMSCDRADRGNCCAPMDVDLGGGASSVVVNGSGRNGGVRRSWNSGGPAAAAAFVESMAPGAMQDTKELAIWCMRHSLHTAQDSGAFGAFQALNALSVVTVLQAYSQHRAASMTAAWTKVMRLARRCPGMLALVRSVPITAALLARSSAGALPQEDYALFASMWGNVCRRNDTSNLLPAAPYGEALAPERYEGTLSPLLLGFVRSYASWAEAALLARTTSNAMVLSA